MPSLSADAMCFLNDYVESELGSFKFLRDPRGCAMVQHDCPNRLLYHLEQPSETTTFSTSLILLAWQLHRFEWLLKKIQRTSNKVERLDFHLTLTCGYLYNSDASNIMTDIRLFIFVSKTSDLLPLTISNQHIEHQDWIDALYTNHGDNRLDRPAGWLHPPVRGSRGDTESRASVQMICIYIPSQVTNTFGRGLQTSRVTGNLWCRKTS
ncbi:hypothetical protein F5880DRAFT_1734187 [Lentinula raphanica]|nr:hypothetical protein F5880DRAFT_1734187 [Lentinula raphanica]